jgi:quercetin dioxygenase-like cupin family protein
MSEGSQRPEGLEKGIASLAANPQRAIHLVDYQEGSVVSREILKMDKGTVTLFAFAEGQGLSEHSAPFDALIYLLEGEAEITISAKPYQLRAGDMIIMPAHQPHAIQGKGRFKMMLVMIRS